MPNDAGSSSLTVKVDAVGKRARLGIFYDGQAKAHFDEQSFCEDQGMTMSHVHEICLPLDCFKRSNDF